MVSLFGSSSGRVAAGSFRSLDMAHPGAVSSNPHIGCDQCCAAPQLLFYDCAVLVGALWGEPPGNGLRSGDTLCLRNSGALCSALGALLTFSTILWYPAYANTTERSGMTALEDQQLGGVIMWIPSGVVFILIGLALFAQWLSESERRVKLGSLQTVLQERERRH